MCLLRGPRYTELLLQDHLAKTADLIRCPRRECQFPMIAAEDTTMVRCQSSKCNFTYCAKCKVNDVEAEGV